MIAVASALSVPDLPRLDASFNVQVEIANTQAIVLDGTGSDMGWFALRGELTRLNLFEGFDELLCLPALHGVDTHWYQVETVRKVLKQYRGRVLLADEVGLGKTVEAGMVLKEYVLRGMAERMLILTPASLVGQWRDEMESKFGIDFATSHDPLLRTDPARFWAQPRVIASIAAARRKEHAELLAGMGYDVIVVDEAHHLRDQSSASYRLVNSLQKRFLLLLSATPVQNSAAGTLQPADLAQAGHFQNPEGVPLGLHGARQAARAGEPRAAARPDARCDGAQYARACGAASAAASRFHDAGNARRERSGLLRELSALAREMASGGAAPHGSAASAGGGGFVAGGGGRGGCSLHRAPSRRTAVGRAARPLPRQCRRREGGRIAGAAGAEPGREEDGVRPPS